MDMSVYDVPDTLAGPAALSEDAAQQAKPPAAETSKRKIVKGESERCTKQKNQVQTVPGRALSLVCLQVTWPKSSLAQAMTLRKAPWSQGRRARILLEKTRLRKTRRSWGYLSLSSTSYLQQ